MSVIETKDLGKAEQTIAYDSNATAIVTNVTNKNEVRIQVGWAITDTRPKAALKMTRQQARVLIDALNAALD